MNGTPRTLSRDRIVYALDRQTSLALTIDSGETVRFETHDARTGTITSTADLLEQPHPDGSNPATGPVWIRDAHPLDSLAVRILDIQLADTAFVAVKKHVGLLAQRADKFATRVVRVRDGWIDYSPGIRFPVRPMVGVIGTAPYGDAIETAYPGAHGGNMDNRYVTTGATRSTCRSSPRATTLTRPWPFALRQKKWPASFRTDSTFHSKTRTC